MKKHSFIFMIIALTAILFITSCYSTRNDKIGDSKFSIQLRREYKNAIKESEDGLVAEYNMRDKNLVMRFYQWDCDPTCDIYNMAAKLSAECYGPGYSEDDSPHLREENVGNIPAIQYIYKDYVFEGETCDMISYLMCDGNYYVEMRLYSFPSDDGESDGFTYALSMFYSITMNQD